MEETVPVTATMMHDFVYQVLMSVRSGSANSLACVSRFRRTNALTREQGHYLRPAYVHKGYPNDFNPRNLIS